MCTRRPVSDGDAEERVVDLDGEEQRATATELVDATADGRGGPAGGRREFGIARPAVAGQRGEKPAVGGAEGRRFPGRDTAGSPGRNGTAVAVLLVAPRLVEDRAPRRPRLDPAGTALAMAGTGLIVYPLIEVEPRHRSAASWIAIALGLVVLAGFVAHQRHAARRGRRPLIETSLFATRAFPAALVTSTLFFAVMNGLMLVIVLQTQLGLGANSLTAGLTLLPWSLGLAVASWVAGAHLVPRFGARVMYAGLALLLTGILGAIAVYHAATPGSYPGSLPAALAVAGLGVGLFTPPFFTAALRRVSPQETGSAAGLLNAVQQLGATLGVAVLGSVYLSGARGGGLSSVQHAFWVAAALLAAAAVGTALMIARREPAEISLPEAPASV